MNSAARTKALAELQRTLDNGVQKIVGVKPGEDDALADAFQVFRQGVAHASSGRLASPKELLGGLGPKDRVLRALLELHSKKRVLHKQIAATMSVLLHTRPWLEALRGDERLCSGLPADLAFLLQEIELEDHEAEPTMPVEPDGHVQRKSFSTPASEKAVKDLDRSREVLEAVGFSAADRDEACNAFEIFRSAVIRIAQSRSSNDDKVLDQFQPKGRTLEFLVDFYERCPRSRARLASCIQRLLDYSSWREAAEADASLHAAVRDLIVDESDEKGPTKPYNAQAAAGDLQKAVEAAAEKGLAGVLYVRIIAAYGLLSADDAGRQSDPFVRVTVGQQVKRTYIVSNSGDPRWDSSPFLFDVPSKDLVARIQVLDSDIVKDNPLGYLEIPVASVPVRHGEGPPFDPARRPLDGVPRGELELEVRLCPARPEAAACAPPRPCRLACWAAAGAGVALLATHLWSSQG